MFQQSGFMRTSVSAVVKSIVLPLLVFMPQYARADVSDFYRKTNVTIGIGSGPGGGYDAYARLLSRHYGRFIPGNPTVVVQNIPGAGGLKGANNLFNIAPKDGSNIAILQNTLTLNQISKSGSVAYDMMKFGWLGSMSTTSTICAFTKNAQIEKASDIFLKEVIIGTSSGSTAMIPAVLNNLAGTRFRSVKGYDSTNNVLLAMERGEVNGVVDGVGIALKCRRVPIWKTMRSRSASTLPMILILI